MALGKYQITRSAKHTDRKSIPGAGLPWTACMNFPRLPLPSFPTREQARSHVHKRSSLELHGLLVSPAQCIFSQEQIQSMSTMFIHLINSKLLCQVVILFCLVISRRFSLKGKTPLIESLFFWFLKNLRQHSFDTWVNRWSDHGLSSSY